MTAVSASRRTWEQEWVDVSAQGLGRRSLGGMCEREGVSIDVVFLVEVVWV